MERIQWWEKFCYGLGSAGGNIANYLIIGYITLFATDVMLLDAASIGKIVMFCAVFDAVTDLMVTSIADRTNTRWGKYRPWLLFTGIPIAATLVILFWYPSFLVSESAKLFWIFGSYFLLSPVFLTGYMCPQYVLLSVITDDDDQRLGLGSARSIGEFVSELLVNGLCMTMVLWFGNGDYQNIAGWRKTVIIFAVLSLGCTLAGFGGARERIFISNRNPEGRQLTLCEKLLILARSRVYRKTLLLNACIMLATVESVLFSYFCIYNLGHEEWIALFATAASLASVIVTALIPAWGRRLGKQRLINLGCVFLAAASLGCVIADGFVMALLFVVCKGMGYGLIISCSGLLWASVSDHISQETGIAIPGLVMATGSFVSKVLMGVCTFLGTMILTIGGFQGALKIQSMNTLNWIRYGITVSLMLAAVFSAIANKNLKELHISSQ